MSGKVVVEYIFHIKDQAITMDVISAVKLKEEAVQINPQLLFQRLSALGMQTDSLSDVLQYKLCTYPPALFLTKTIPRQPTKTQLADVMWKSMPKPAALPSTDRTYIIDAAS